ncbi:hypothetical protein TFLX_05732 [Thermoflexales bacterium]|nr:hypothetical protein TFLX_05732 [Thermoflexales bacterium]
MMRRWIVCMAALWLVGCADTSQSNVIATPTVMPIQPIVTPTALAGRVQTRLVSDRPVFNFDWESDGRTLVYAQSEKCSTGCKTNWYRFNAATGVTTTFKSEIVTIDPRVWKRLSNFENPPEISPRRSPSVSPSGTWVIYSRMSPIYTPPPCPQGPCLPPMELWLARVDGSESFKVSNLELGNYCVGLGWFEAEHKVLLSCAYEGPGHFIVADLTTHELIDVDKIIGEPVIALEMAVLSPEGTRFAVNRMVTRTVELQAISLTDSAIINLGQGAIAPQWSIDGQHLYYWQRLIQDQCTPAAIHVYDFATGKNRIILGLEVVLSLTQHVTLDACEHTFLVSPTEDAVLLVLGESGSWIVGLH